MNRFTELIQQQFQQKPITNHPHALSATKKLEEELMAELNDMKPRSTRKKSKKAKKKFSKHPKEMHSDSELSVSASPKATKSCSSDSHVDLLYQNACFKKAKLSKSPRKKLAAESRLWEDDSFVDVNAFTKTDWHVMGDSSNIQPKAENCEQNLNCVKILLEKKYSLQSDIVNEAGSKIKLVERSKTFPVVKVNDAKQVDNRKFECKKSNYIIENPDLRLRNILQKILTFLNDISNFIDEGEVEPDGAEDLERRRKRANEFSTRFSRNYLYQLSRYVSDLEALCKTKTPRSLSQHNSDIHLKLISSHQIILQSLQAYHKQMPTTLLQLTFDKLSQLLTLSLSLCSIHRNNINLDCTGSSKRENLIEDFEHKSTLLSRKLGDISRLNSVCALFKAPTVTNTKVTLLSQKSKAPKNKTNDLSGKLSMYTISNVTAEGWKRSAANLAKKKFNVRSRYKEATLKHRPPPIAPVIIHTNKVKLCDKRSSGFIRTTPMYQSLNEDSIVTMIEAENKKDEEENTDKKSSSNELDKNKDCTKTDSVKCLLNDFMKNSINNNGDVSQEYLQSALTQLLSMVQKKNSKIGSKGDNESTTDNNTIVQPPCDAVHAPLSIQPAASVLDLVDINMKMDNNNEVRADLFKSKTEIPLAPIKKNDNDKIVPPLDLKMHKEQSGVKRPPKRSNLKVTGEKNAKLYYMVHDSSISESSIDENVKKENVVTETQTDDSLNRVEFEGCQLVYKERELLSIPDKNSVIKISRLPKQKKPKKCLTLLPKDYIMNVVQYKLQFSRHSKKNHMYKKSTTIQPWILLGKISDKILDSALFDIAREIEVNDIIESLYRSEFQ